ncbi:hypothetical protein JCM11491_001019 [Sporobolomyces phaffii]
MGISGLLPLLKEITVQSHIKEWKGKTLAVDAYVWLHRGAYGCAEELATGKPTVKYVNYAMHRVRMLKYYGVTPFIVFDGGLLPSKMGTEGDREKRRNEALAKGNSFRAEGKHSQAREAYVKAVDVTPEMAYQLIKALRQEGIQYVVAPYEADPQLAYLEKEGIVDGIITEDSDLLVFGCRNVLFKLDGEGHCHAISRSDFSKCRDYNFSDWTDQEFRQMAILSGCDYLDSIPGMGLKTAYRLMRKYKTADKVIQFVRLDGQMTVPRNYVEEFRRADLTFLHQRVFDPAQRRLVHFSPLPDSITDADAELPFVGGHLDPEYVCRLADGEIDPISKLPIRDLMPDSFSTTVESSSSPSPAIRTAHRTTYKPAPTASTSAKAKPSAASVQPAKGAASLLNFFSRTPNATTTSPVNPVKTSARRAQEEKRGAGKENGNSTRVKAVIAPSPKRKSKFFGGRQKGVSSGGQVQQAIDKGKGKEEMKINSDLDDDDDDDDDIMIIEAADDSEGDIDAELALRDVEMVVSMAASSSKADSGGGGSEPECAASPARPPSPTPCVSSPIATPPPRQIPVQVPHLGTDARQTLGHDDDAVAISSPASSAQAEAGWDDDQPNVRDSVLSSPPRKARTAVSPLVVQAPARPLPPPRACRADNDGNVVKLEQVVVKREVDVSVAATISRHVAAEFIELSSDPIDALSSSDGALDGTRTLGEVTPRPPPRRAPAEPRPSSSSSSSQDRKPTVVKKETKSKPRSVSVRPDALPAGTGKGKKRGVVLEDDEDDTEGAQVGTAVQNVAASWRAKFMLQNSSASRTPRPKTTTAKPSVTAATACDTSMAKSRAKLAVAGRAPLSPRSTNDRTTSRPFLGLKPLAPLHLTENTTTTKTTTNSVVSKERTAASSPKKRRTGSCTSPPAAPLDLSSPDAVAATAAAPSSFEIHKGSSSPIVITNPKLLAFRFKGSSSPSS